MHRVSFSKLAELRQAHAPSMMRSSPLVVEENRKDWTEVNHEIKESCAPFSTEIESVYAFAPELTDSSVPLRSSLVLGDRVGAARKAPLFELKKARRGLSGKVKFIKFSNDPIDGRYFAIKRPLNLFSLYISRIPPNPKTTVEYYKKNLSISRELGDHPNFMKVHGLVVKDNHLKKRAKPYLILEYLEGKCLGDIPEMPCERVSDLLRQLKDAVLHMHDHEITPCDANLGNVIITPDWQLKFIDFDAWIEKEPVDYQRYIIMLKTVGAKLMNCRKDFLDIHATSREELEQACDQLMQIWDTEILPYV